MQTDTGKLLSVSTKIQASNTYYKPLAFNSHQNNTDNTSIPNWIKNCFNLLFSTIKSQVAKLNAVCLCHMVHATELEFIVQSQLQYTMPCTFICLNSKPTVNLTICHS